MATLQLICTTMSVCDPYRDLELYLEQVNSDISEVFNNWAREAFRSHNELTAGVSTRPVNRNESRHRRESCKSHDSSSVLSLPSTSRSDNTSGKGTIKPHNITSAPPRVSNHRPLISERYPYQNSIPFPYVDDSDSTDTCDELQRPGDWQGLSPFSWTDDSDLELYTSTPGTRKGKQPQKKKKPLPSEYLYPLTAKLLCTIHYDPDQEEEVLAAAYHLGEALMRGELHHLAPSADSDSGICSPVTDGSTKEVNLSMDQAIAEGSVAGGYSESKYLNWRPPTSSQMWGMQDMVDIIKTIVPITTAATVNRQKLVAVQKLRTRLQLSIIFDIEATEACRWLRAAGFPQYAQMYENNQFPVEIQSVEQDHPQLEGSVLASLFRRLHVLNRCARLHQQKACQQQSDWDDEECALSANWTYQSDVRRWSRVGRDLEIPNVGSKEWHKLNNAMNSVVDITAETTDTAPSSLPATFTPPLRERDVSIQQPKILRVGSAKIRRRASTNRDLFESPPISTTRSSNTSAAHSPLAASVLDMLSQQLRNLNASQMNVNEMGQSGSSAVSTSSLAVADVEGTLPRTNRRSKTHSLDKSDMPGMPFPPEKTSRFGMDAVLASLGASKSMFSRSAWQSQSRAAAAVDIPEEHLELEDGGRPISTLSCTQLHVLRKLALLKLTAFMERFCPAHRTGWNWDLPRIIMRKTKSHSYKEHAIFGVPITITLQRTGYPLPRSIELALDWLAVNGKDQVGIFRRSGVKSRIQSLRVLMEERGHTVDFNAYQAYDTADMVKQYFRELPDALLTNKLSETFILIIQHVPLSLRRESILCAILLLPDEHTEVLRVLLSFLRDLAQYSDDHQMTIGNLAVCFAPSLFHYQQVPQSRQGLGQPHAKELAESYAAHDCLTYLLQHYDNVFAIPRELFEQCKGDEIKESTVLHLNQLGAESNGNWRSYLQECQNALMREVREKNRGWLTVASHYPRIELAYKKVADGHPLRLWKISGEVEAPPVEVMHRILRERHVWDEDLVAMRIVQIIADDTEVHQYHHRNIKPLPVEDYCIIRMWKSDLHKGACMIVETSVELDDAATVPDSVRSIVLASRYLIEPCGSGRSKVVHLARVDTRGRMPEWSQKNYGHVCSILISNLQSSFRKSAIGPESKV